MQTIVSLFFAKQKTSSISEKFLWRCVVFGHLLPLTFWSEYRPEGRSKTAKFMYTTTCKSLTSGLLHGKVRLKIRCTDRQFDCSCFSWKPDWVRERMDQSNCEGWNSRPRPSFFLSHTQSKAQYFLFYKTNSISRPASYLVSKVPWVFLNIIDFALIYHISLAKTGDLF